MKFSLKYFEGNRNGLSVSVNKQVAKEVKQYGAPGQDKDSQSDLVKELFKLDGIGAVMVYPYEVFVRKGDMFEWKDLVQPVLDTILKKLDPDGKLEWVKPAVMKQVGEGGERELYDNPTYPDPGAPPSKHNIEAPSVLKAEAERQPTPGAGDLRWQQYRDGE
jgi:hypothetical protein